MSNVHRSRKHWECKYLVVNVHIFCKLDKDKKDKFEDHVYEQSVIKRTEQKIKKASLSDIK